MATNSDTEHTGFNPDLSKAMTVTELHGVLAGMIGNGYSDSPVVIFDANGVAVPLAKSLGILPVDYMAHPLRTQLAEVLFGWLAE